MELLVTRAKDPVLELRKAALQNMVKEIRTATSSMTSVPKPLKFLRPHYSTLKETYAAAKADETKTMLADVLSMLAMTTSEPGARESLQFKLEGTPSDLASWGHEYVRHLAGEIGEEYNERLEDKAGAKKPAADLMPLILEHMVPFFIEHNAEAEAIDLLSEVGMAWLQLETWDLNVMALTDQQRQAVIMSLLLYERGSDIGSSYGELLRTYGNFIDTVRSGYGAQHVVPYHNWNHAVDVSWMLHRTMNICAVEHFLSQHERFALMASAMCHDIGHPGVNNIFLIETAHELALRYFGSL